MKDTLPEIDSLEVKRGGAWPGIIGGILGGLVGLIIVKNFQPHYFYFIVNVIIGGAALGSLYGRVEGTDIKAIRIWALVGTLLGLSSIFFRVFVLIPFVAFAGGGIFLSLYLRDKDLYSDRCETAALIAGGVIFVFYVIGVISDIATKAGAGQKALGIFTAIFLPVIVYLFVRFPLVHIPAAFIVGGVLGYFLASWIDYIYFFGRPFFAVPLFVFAGYFIGCKITEGKKPREEYLKEVPTGGLSMAENQNFPQKVTEDMSIIAFSEKAMIQDLLGALNNRSLLLTKIDSWKARAKAQNQLRAFEMIKEIFQKEAEAIRAYTEAQQARLDFENLKEFNQHIQREKLKSQLAEEKYKQAELKEKLKRMKLEEERKRLQLQQEIERLKRTQEITESRIERLKKEELEKIDFQEEIRKIKSIKLGERAEYFHNWKKRIKEKYSPKEAEEIIDEFERMLVEEGLKEE